MQRTISSFSRFLSAGTLVAAATAVMCGCTQKQGTPRQASPRAASQGPTSDSRFPVVHEDWAKVGYRLDWVGFPFGVDDRPVKLAAMNVQSDFVIVQRDSSAVTLMEATTGKNRWSTELTGPLTKWVGVTREEGPAGRLLVASESEIFVLAPATGNLLGRQRLARVVNTPPLLMGDTAVFGTSLGVVHAHNLNNGLPLWAFATDASIEGALMEVQGVVAAVSQRGDVMFLNAAGNMIGRARVFGSLDCDPATDGNRLYIACHDQSLWAFEITGATAWRLRTSNPLMASPTLHDGALYVDLGAQGLSRLDPESGSIHWSNPNAHGRVIGIRGGRLLVWNAGSLATLDPATGDIVSQAAVPGVVTVAPDAFVDGHLYAVSDRGVVAKFMPR